MAATRDMTEHRLIYECDHEMYNDGPFLAPLPRREGVQYHEFPYLCKDCQKHYCQMMLKKNDYGLQCVLAEIDLKIEGILSDPQSSDPRKKTERRVAYLENLKDELRLENVVERQRILVAYARLYDDHL
jgi:hypothetical protein